MVKFIATYAETAINTAANPHEIVVIKEQALTAIASAKAAYNSALGELGMEQNGPAVEVTDQDGKTIKPYNPKNVNFIKVTRE